MNILGSTKSSFIYNKGSSGGGSGISALLATANVWCDATDTTTIYNNTTNVTTNGSNMNKWLNKNNTAYYFSGNSGNTFKLNNTFNTNKQGIQVISSGTWMTYSNPSTLPFTNYSIFIIGNMSADGPNAFAGIGSATTTGNNAQLQLAYGTNVYIYNGGAVTNQEYATGFNSSPYGSSCLTTKPFIFEYLKTQGTNDAYYTGTAMAYAKNNATSTGSTTQTFFSLFCYNNDGSFAMPVNSYLSEVLVFSTKLSDSDRQMVEGYLAWKYNIQNYLPASHPYKSSAPT